jgi:hypothetical protein
MNTQCEWIKARDGALVHYTRNQSKSYDVNESKWAMTHYKGVLNQSGYCSHIDKGACSFYCSLLFREDAMITMCKSFCSWPASPEHIPYTDWLVAYSEATLPPELAMCLARGCPCLPLCAMLLPFGCTQKRPLTCECPLFRVAHLFAD